MDNRLFLFRPVKNTLLFFLLILHAVACQNTESKTGSAEDANEKERAYARAIQDILEKDAVLGDLRNHACEDTTLAETIRQYVAGIDALDFSSCPDDFTAAFQRHRDAWEASISFFEAFDALRGEMHDLFNEIEAAGEKQQAGLAQHRKAIFDTWGEVEATARGNNILME